MAHWDDARRRLDVVRGFDGVCLIFFGGAGFVLFGRSGMPAAMSSWASQQLKKINGKDDLTLLEFCMSLTDASEIRQYLAAYLGSTPEVGGKDSSVGGEGYDGGRFVEGRERGAGLCTPFVHGRGRMTIDPGIPTIPRRSTSGFHQAGRQVCVCGGGYLFHA